MNQRAFDYWRNIDTVIGESSVRERVVDPNRALVKAAPVPADAWAALDSGGAGAVLCQRALYESQAGS
jgi:hypothetical protein